MPAGDESASLPEESESPRLRALFLNCTLKPSPQESHTDALIEACRVIMRGAGVRVEALRPVDYELAPGVQPDMTEHGFERDDWPELFGRIMRCDILVVTTPIWLGEKSSVCTRVIERLYSNSGQTNKRGQYIYYGRVGGCLITGNEDGAKHCAMNILYSLQHVGFTIPPQADAGWIGEAGPGPSYRDEESHGPENEFTNRTTTFMTWNLIHTARLINNAGGLPIYGNDMEGWNNGERFGHPGAAALRRLRGGPSAR